MTFKKSPSVNAIIIDDEALIVDMIKTQIESMNLFKNVVSAEDGLIAMNKIHNQDFSLIILDLNLPKKSGVDILKRLVAENKSFAQKILVISGDLVKKTLETILGLGVKNFLVKPFDQKSLEAKIKLILSQSNIAL